jgi:hypothetical protein
MCMPCTSRRDQLSSVCAVAQKTMNLHTIWLKYRTILPFWFLINVCMQIKYELSKMFKANKSKICIRCTNNRWFAFFAVADAQVAGWCRRTITIQVMKFEENVDFNLILIAMIYSYYCVYIYEREANKSSHIRRQWSDG